MAIIQQYTTQRLQGDARIELAALGGGFHAGAAGLALGALRQRSRGVEVNSKDYCALADALVARLRAMPAGLPIHRSVGRDGWERPRSHIGATL